MARSRLSHANDRLFERTLDADLTKFRASGQHENKSYRHDRSQSANVAHHNPFTIPSTIFLASANSIMVLSRKNSSFSTPA